MRVSDNQLLLNLVHKSFIAIVLEAVFVIIIGVLLIVKLLVLWVKRFKTYLCICIYFVQKKTCWFKKDCHYSVTVGHRMLSVLSLYYIFNALSIGVNENPLISITLFWSKPPSKRGFLNMLIYMKFHFIFAQLVNIPFSSRVSYFCVYIYYTNALCF